MSNIGPPRLPMLHVEGFEAPATEPGPVARVDQQIEADRDREVYKGTFPLNTTGVGGPGPVSEQVIYKTFAPWGAVDVYTQVIPPPGGLSSQIVLSVFIFAIVGGVRALVASGRQVLLPGVAALPARWIAGIRSVAQRYEVTTFVTQFSGAPFVRGQLNIGIAASNEFVDLPEEIGSEAAGPCYLSGANNASIGDGVAGVQIPPRLELVQLRGVNGAAAARFLQLHDTTLNILPPGSVPIAEWPLGDAIGDGLPDVKYIYRCTKRVQLLVSSTMGALTQVTDCRVSALLK